MIRILVPGFVLCMVIIISLQACSQNTNQNRHQNKTPEKELVVGDYCDECDLMFEGMPAVQNISWRTTIAASKEPGERMNINGVVYKRDSKTPPEGVILYIYHTDATGIYSRSTNQIVGKRNGHLRGWVKTNKDGRFYFESIRPAPYPGRNIPAHIHFLVKEPNKTRYYIDEIWFDDDPLITTSLRNKPEQRGGNQIIHVTKTKDGIWQGEIKIILGMNIPNYK